MKAYTLIFLLGFIAKYSYCQKCNCKYPVFHDGVIALRQFKAPDTLIQNYNSYTLEKYIFIDCYGTLKYEKYDTSGLALVKGNLIGEKVVVKKKVLRSDLEGNLKGTIKIKEYEPYKEGVWMYYDRNGNINREEYYEKGKLISTKNF